MANLKELKNNIAVNLNLPFLYSKNNSFSQDGEDKILRSIFPNKKFGFFVDVGAHHPFRYSNTQMLYLMGWNGINIEPTPKNIKLFNKTRKKDINIQKAVGKNKSKLALYCFKDSALNTTSKSRADITIQSKQSILVEIIKVEVDTLEHILNDHLNNNKIDLLNIDVEGRELEVLKSNNWKCYSPDVIIVENLNHTDAIPVYLKEKGYYLNEKTKMSEIYKLKR